MTTKLKTLDFGFEVKSIKAEGDTGFVEGFASTFNNTDLVGDVIVRGAFTDTIRNITAAKGHIPMLWQHDRRNPIGKFRAEHMSEDGKGLFVKGEINLKVQQGRETFELLKADDISDFSIGFRTLEEEFDTARHVNIIQKIDLKEISLVTFPANIEAVVTGVKSVTPYEDLSILRCNDGSPNTKQDWDEGKAIENIKAFDGENTIYLWHDVENEKSFGVISDVIGGEIVVVPRAVFAAAGALAGMRGEMADEEKAGVQRNIERYYEKMDLESPFKKGLGPNELGRMSPKQIKSYMRANGFSNAGAEYASNMIKTGIKSLSDLGGKSQSDSDQTVTGLKELRDALKSNLGG